MNQDFSKAIKYYKKAADNGNSYSMSILGDLYFNGKGVEPDQKKAIKYYKKRQILEIEMQLTVSMQ